MADESSQQPDGEIKGPMDEQQPRQAMKMKSRAKDRENGQIAKRRCVSTACIACRKRKSKVSQSVIFWATVVHILTPLKVRWKHSQLRSLLLRLPYSL